MPSSALNTAHDSLCCHGQLRRRQLLKHLFCTVVGASSVIGAQAHALSTIKLRDLYNKDLSFSDLALQVKGQRIDVKGYMAPPLKAQSRFFVITIRPMTTCPFCNDGDDWPDDIAAVYAKRVVDVQPFNVGIVVNATLELGDYTDPDTGFFSRVRLTNAVFRRA